MHRGGEEAVVLLQLDGRDRHALRRELLTTVADAPQPQTIT
jgi:hypothetical protein